jgi:hypothetical protein
MWCKLLIITSPIEKTAMKAVTAGLRCRCLDKNGDTDDDRQTQGCRFYHHTQATCRIRSSGGHAPAGGGDAQHAHGGRGCRANRSTPPRQRTKSEHPSQWVSDQENEAPPQAARSALDAEHDGQADRRAKGPEHSRITYSKSPMVPSPVGRTGHRAQGSRGPCTGINTHSKIS